MFTLRLQEAGYQLACTGKTWGPGRLEGFASDGEPLADFSYRAETTEAVTGPAYETIKLPPKPGLNNTDYAANFEAFLRERDVSKPFLFWYGAMEPHQNYDVDAWKRTDKQLEDAVLPGCLPDDPVTRGEILDYCLEIEHFDRHLGRMIATLEREGLLDDTLLVVTSDHGNPLPRSKCNLYDSGTRVPLAMRWPRRITAGQEFDAFVNLIDLAPPFLAAAETDPLEKATGRSLWPLFEDSSREQEIAERDFVVTALERHIITRRDGVGYPMRSIRTYDYAYIRNYEPDRWPAGDPDFVSSHHGVFGDCDMGASKQFLVANAFDREVHPYYLLCFGRRPAEELYDMRNRPASIAEPGRRSPQSLR